MQDLTLSRDTLALATPPFDLDARDTPAAVGPKLIPGSPIARMRDAALKGDVDALRFQSVAMRDAMVELRAAADETAIDRIVGALERLGVDAGKLVGRVTAYISLAQSAIDLINALLGFSNAFTGVDTVTSTGVFAGELGVQIVAVQHRVEVRKEHKGFVIGDNDEDILRARMQLDVVQGPPASSVSLALTLRAFGVGQDRMTAPLMITAGDDNGRPAPDQTATQIDTAGTEIRQVSGFVRSGVQSLTIDLSPAPGSIVYGLNGANVALLLEASGVAQFPFGAVPLRFARAIDVGLSI